MTVNGCTRSTRHRRAPYRVLFSGLAFAVEGGAEKAQPLRWAFSWVLVSNVAPFLLIVVTFDTLL